MVRMILFDVDGVFLSEERCFDVSALSTRELVTGDKFLGLRDGLTVRGDSDSDMTTVRKVVFRDDAVLDWLKKRGVNSNWDMVFLATGAQLFLYLKRLFRTEPQEVKRFLTGFADARSLREIREWAGEEGRSHQADYAGFFSVFQGAEHVERDGLLDWFNRLAKEWFGVETDRFGPSGPLWEAGRSLFQEWYLGDALYRQMEGREPLTPGKEGFLHRETPLAEPQRLRDLLSRLREKGIAVGIGTGRTEPETRIPLESLGIWECFDPEHVATATDVREAERSFPDRTPLGKPDPFTYVRAFLGRSVSVRECLDHPLPLADGQSVWVVGDSVADYLAAKAMGCGFVATLTGLTGERARETFERLGVDRIIRDVTELEELFA
ncbi:HAD family hydrolase [Staphylospora marina]|uniref:HAD family hydrolase n=1 Tax=Staphylospora marina TaxID=2490858 RepID=UPI000F5BAD61|nr:HAD family hydrolase [Staphylospora marina]